MKKAGMSRVDRLHKIQGEVQKSLQDVADHLGKLAIGGIILSEDQWDKHFDALDQAKELAQKVGEALEREYNEAMKKAREP